MNTHPYFTGKARKVMDDAGGLPSLAGPLAEWAEAAHRNPDPARGVIVSAAGELLAETRHSQRPVGSATYVTRVLAANHDAVAEATNREAGLALAALRRITGTPAIHVRYSDVATGPRAADVTDPVPSPTGRYRLADLSGARPAVAGPPATADELGDRLCEAFGVDVPQPEYALTYPNGDYIPDLVDALVSALDRGDQADAAVNAAKLSVRVEATTRGETDE